MSDKQRQVQPEELTRGCDVMFVNSNGRNVAWVFGRWDVYMGELQGSPAGDPKCCANGEARKFMQGVAEKLGCQLITADGYEFLLR